MKLKFKKLGIVTVGTADAAQQINLQNPIGWPKELNFDMENNAVNMTVIATDEDGRNEVCRQYPMELTVEAMQALVQLFATHIRPIAREQYSEFVDLVELPIEP